MATLTKRGPYQWQVKIRRKGYPPQSKTFESKSEAEDWVNVIESEMVRGLFIDRSEAEKTSFQQLIDRYLAEVLPRKKSQIPINASLSIIGKELGEYRLANLTSSVIAKFRDKRLDDNRSAETVRKDLSVIHRVINIAIKECGIAFPAGNPASLVKMPSRGLPRSTVGSSGRTVANEACTSLWQQHGGNHRTGDRNSNAPFRNRESALGIY